MRKQDAFNMAHDEEFEILHNSHGEYLKFWSVNVQVMVSTTLSIKAHDESEAIQECKDYAEGMVEKGMMDLDGEYDVVKSEVTSVERAT